MKIINVIFLFFFMFLGHCYSQSKPTNAEALHYEDCTFNGIPLKGKVKVVEHFADFKVQIVSNFSDIDVKIVTAFPDDCGEWQFVENFADFTIQYVTSFPDIKVRFVEVFPGIKK